jgi:putative hydrolase of the HAD superfamily
MAKFLGKDAFNTQKAIDRIIYGKWLDTIKTMKPYTGIRELIISLRKCGFKTALLSDLPVERKLSYLGLEGIWDVAFSSEETNYLKPNLVPFQRLITMLGEKPENIIYIGDNYKYDVLGARLAGMKTIYFSNKSKNKNLADFHFKHYSDLKKYLTSLTEIKKNHGSCL